jgi:hypothetical protein
MRTFVLRGVVVPIVIGCLVGFGFGLFLAPTSQRPGSFPRVVHETCSAGIPEPQSSAKARVGAFGNDVFVLRCYRLP